MNTVIATGWCVDNNRPKIHTPSKRVYEPEWFSTWHNYHYKQGGGLYCVYESLSDQKLQLIESSLFDQHIKARVNFKDLPGRHDWVASFLAGCQSALFNNSHLVYIEQDCLVKGLGDIIEISEDYVDNIAYGFGDYSFQTGWAETSFIYVHNSFLKETIIRILGSDILETSQPIEPIFHNLFKDKFIAWPFGYGRVRPIDFNEKIYYAQQMNDEEINKTLNI